jgi:hypothetical protein
MSKGTNRITIRVPDALRDDIADAVEKRKADPMMSKQWTMTEYIVQAIVDKLNHDRRSRKDDGKRRQLKQESNEPREYWEE